MRNVWPEGVWIFKSPVPAGIAGSPAGGIAQTQEMLDFCAKKQVLPDCEMITIDTINEAFERMERGDVRYRFVIDMSSLAE